MIYMSIYILNGLIKQQQIQKQICDWLHIQGGRCSSLFLLEPISFW